jgi:hypothetical protein
MIISQKSQKSLKSLKSLKTIKFWQFGCWNNLNTKKNKPIGCLNQVIKLINDKSYPQENKPEFLIVSGDNYYPDKIKPEGDMNPTTKNKIIYSEKLQQGIASLPDNIKINMILGNHDLETNSEDNLFIDSLSLENKEKNDCKIIQLELEALKKKENIDYFFFKSQLLNNETLLLMIDTSIYDVDAVIYLPCYNKFFKDNVFYKNEELNFDSITKLRSFQLNKIMKAIKKNIHIKYLIIVGHHPIYQLKNKTIQEVQTVKYTSEIHINFTPVLKSIYKILQDNTKYYYLCSDLHLYQKGIIEIEVTSEEPKSTMTIQQYIVGTGGTKLDDALPTPIDTEKLYKSANVNYTLEEERKECGFLECIIHISNEPSFEFIAIPSLVGGKKYKTKTKKFKSKAKKYKTKTKKFKSKAKKI